MKTANLGEYFLWRGEITRVDSINNGHKSICFNTKKQVQCPHCKESHEVDDWMDIIESSPMFQEGAEPIKSIKEVPEEEWQPNIKLTWKT